MTTSSTQHWPTFSELRGKRVPPHRVLGVDPGQTTGWALFVDGVLEESGHVDTSTPRLLLPFLTKWADVDVAVVELYSIYPNKLKEHSGSSVFTLQIIGGIRYFYESRGTQVTMQPAAVAKSFMTDAKLKAWGMWSTNRHARDAIRHGGWYLLFSKRV